jgi:hypothetical protein
VTSVGDVTVTLETGDIDRTCTFAMTNSTTGGCSYTVQAGDVSADLTVASISCVIKDQFDNAMSSYTVLANLAENKDLVIDTVAPSVSFVTPTDGEIVSGSSFSISVIASDNNQITDVTFKRDTDTVIGTDATAPYSVDWDTTALQNGTQTLIAVVRDAAGNYATSSVVVVTIENQTESSESDDTESSSGGGQSYQRAHTSATSSIETKGSIKSAPEQTTGATNVSSDSVTEETLKAATPAKVIETIDTLIGAVKQYAVSEAPDVSLIRRLLNQINRLFGLLLG